MGDTSDVVSGAGMLYPAPHRLGSQEFGGDTPWLWLLKSFLKSTSPEPGWRWPLPPEVCLGRRQGQCTTCHEADLISAYG